MNCLVENVFCKNIICIIFLVGFLYQVILKLCCILVIFYNCFEMWFFVSYFLEDCSEIVWMIYVRDNYEQVNCLIYLNYDELYD